MSLYTYAYCGRSSISELIQSDRKPAHIYFTVLCWSVFLSKHSCSIAVVYTVIDTTNIINVSHAQPHTVYNVSMSSAVEITQHTGFQWSKPTNCCSVSLSSQKLVYVVDHSDGKKNNHKS